MMMEYMNFYAPQLLTRERLEKVYSYTSKIYENSPESLTEEKRVETEMFLESLGKYLGKES